MYLKKIAGKIGLGVLLMLLGVGLVVAFLFRREIAFATKYMSASKEQTYLILLQNSLELRPTGGFVGNFLEVTMKGQKVVRFQVYNTNAFDFGKDGFPAPEPFQAMINVDTLQMRDGNWSPDFPTTARNMIALYDLQGGKKNIDGVIGVTAEILPRLIELTGPVYLEGFDDAITAENALLEIQYDTNFGFLDRGLSRGNRKQAIVEVAEILIERIERSSYTEKLAIIGLFRELALENQILMYFHDSEMQQSVEQLGFDGRVAAVEGDYVYVVDANMGALKTDYYMERDISKKVEKCEKGMCVTLQITYTNTAVKASPLNNDYRSYSRVYLAEDAWVESVEGNESDWGVDYSIEYDKKVAGFEVIVPFGSSRTVTIMYYTPARENYMLYVQKQPGVEEIDFSLDVSGMKVEQRLRTDQIFTF
jgi:hypothetical protein